VESTVKEINSIMEDVGERLDAKLAQLEDELNQFRDSIYSLYECYENGNLLCKRGFESCHKYSWLKSWV
jgi:hypothetical protein